jgi:hypothetical protein
MKKRKNSLLLTILVFIFLWSGSAKADIPNVKNLKVFFKENGKDYNKPVNFTVDCYGYTCEGIPIYEATDRDNCINSPASKKGKVMSFSSSCANYGCEFNQSFYFNYRVIEYCDIEGESEGRKFKVEKFSNTPFSDCEKIPLKYIGYENGTRLLATSEYDGCIERKGKENPYKDRPPNTKECDQYIKREKGNSSFESNNPSETCKIEVDIALDKKNPSNSSSHGGFFHSFWCFIKSFFGHSC